MKKLSSGKSRVVVEGQASEVFLPASADFPLADTFLCPGPSQNHPETVRPIEPVVGTTLPRVARLFEALSAEPGLTVPPLNHACSIQERAPTPISAGLVAEPELNSLGSVAEDPSVLSLFGAQL